jgi:hypothetical protein
MKKLNNSLLKMLILTTCVAAPAVAQEADSLLIRCASTERDSVRIAKNPALMQLRLKSEQAIRRHIDLNKSTFRTSADEIITIPVVVHVIYDREDGRIGGAGNPNITEEQIQNQIDVLNEDYGNASGYKGFYTDSHGVDTGIRFKLVTIVRERTTKTQFNPLTDAGTLAGISPAWFTNRYLNIWVCKLADRYLGTSQFPVVTEINDRTNGLSMSEDEEIDALTDGVIIDFRYFGRNSDAITSAVYNLGRTTTHEVGHWLGLIHTWGDTFCGTDYCDDTPVAYTKNETTDVSCTPVFSQCNGVNSRNMIENYMDYSPDACMSVFTADQKARMRAIMELSPRRAKLVEYSRLTDQDVKVEIYPNPVHEYLTADVYTPSYEPFTVSVFNDKGQKVLEDRVNRTYVDVKNFPGGLYFYRITTGSQTITRKFVVR